MLLVYASAAFAAVTIQPASPVAGDFITAHIDVPGGCGVSTSTTISGSVIRTQVVLTGCVVGPPPFTVLQVEPLGELPAGTYTYEVYFTFDSDPPALESQQTFVVAQAPARIPALHPLLLVALAGVLAMLAMVVLRRV